MSAEKKARANAQPTPETGPTATPEAPELAVPDVYPDFATTPEEVTHRTAELRDYVRNHMNEGEDYGIIPGGSKPTLFKPGAEKLNAVFGLAPIVEVVNRHEDWDAGFVAYEVKVTLLNKRTGGIEAEGIGSCNSRERRYKNQDAAGIANTVLKMGKKRALVDATLSATRASGLFTQDLEDLDLEPQREYQSAPRVVESSAQRQAPRGNQAATATRENPPSSAEGLTDAQHRAILAIAGRVFGRHSREEDLDRMVNKPLEELSKSEASRLIDELRQMLGEQEQGGAPNNEANFVRAGDRSAHNGAAR